MAAANADPSDVVANRLDALAMTLPNAGALTLTLGSNLFTGPVRPAGTGIAEGPVVFCLASGGALWEPYLGVDKDVRTKTVQVRVRSTPGQFEDGQYLAVEVHKRLHKSAPSGTIDVLVREPYPNYLRQNEQDSHEWSLNVEVRVVEATA